MRASRTAGAFVAASLLVASSIDRLGWARLAQWREDQATNLWLGFTRSVSELPVGLVSSVGIPNPNGMPLLAIPLSRLPGLYAVSWALGIVQAALVVGLCFSLSLGLIQRTALALVLLSSVLLRASSVEFWNNWVLVSLNLAFAISVVRYLRRPSLRWLPVWAFLVMLAPSLYLAGLVNGIVYAGTAGLLLFAHRPVSSPMTRRLAISASAAVVIASAWATWIPYAREVGWAGIHAASPQGPATRILGAAASLVRSPLWHPGPWLDASSFVILQSSREILSSRAQAALGWTHRLLAAQVLTLLLVFALFVWSRWAHRRDAVRPGPAPAFRETAWLAGVVVAAYVLSPLLGGPVWAGGARMEMALQWFPLLVVGWFGGAMVLPLPPAPAGVARSATVAIAVLLAAANLVLGRAVEDSYFSYRGPVLVPADVPLPDKIAVVDLVAADARARQAGGSVAIDYDLGGGVWDWVPSFGEGLGRWYPAPMTLGRAFDYELLRRHGLANSQEGRVRAPPGGGRYLVGYPWTPPPSPPGGMVHHVPVGRLRLTVVDR